VLVKKNKMINKYFVYYYQMLLKLIIKWKNAECLVNV
jgi:hypothetical protein